MSLREASGRAEAALLNFIHTIEGLSVWVGRAFGWCIMILTFSVAYEVFVRYVLNAPTVWAFDMMVQMYGALFLMAGPYALAQDAHVRGDVLYRLFPVRWQARIDFVLYLLFFFPGMMALFWFGWEIAADSWRYQEVSWNSPGTHPDLLLQDADPACRVLVDASGPCRTCPLLEGNEDGSNGPSGWMTFARQRTC